MTMRNIRIQLFMTTLVLVCIGTVMIFSASSIYAAERFKDSTYFLGRHLLFLLIGGILAFLAMCVPYKKLQSWARPLVFISLGLLALVLVPHIGREVSGARRWFRIGFFSFQPSEFAALCVVVYVADFISRRSNQVKTLRHGLLPVLAVLGIVSILILLEPDLGTTLSICVTVMIMLFIGGMRLVYLGGLVLSAIPALYLLIAHVAYRRSRILAFLNPWADPRGSGFQIIQSQIALGSGGIFGEGLGHSRQKLFYLPAAHTDFIFSIIGEELGLLGTIGIIILFLIFIRLSLQIIKNTNDRFGYFLGVGLLALITFKAMVNIGVSCGILPTKGLPLPFISYGGSSFIFDLVSVGLLLNVAKQGEYP
ncbi:MAG: putative lipid II flippase FtsW [Deltaproteobacteria bacterium]